jgi:hypothetical protein
MTGGVVGAVSLHLGKCQFRFFFADVAPEMPAEKQRSRDVSGLVEKGRGGNGAVTVLHELDT